MITFILAILIGIQHLAFLILEMFLWTKPAGLKIFRLSLAASQQSKVLAANQGLYNGFLAVGLFWATVHSEVIFQYQLKLFFFGCVALAGAFGGVTVNRRVFFMQGLPAIIAVVLTLAHL